MEKEVDSVLWIPSNKKLRPAVVCTEKFDSNADVISFNEHAGKLEEYPNEIVIVSPISGLKEGVLEDILILIYTKSDGKDTYVRKGKGINVNACGSHFCCSQNKECKILHACTLNQTCK